MLIRSLLGIVGVTLADGVNFCEIGFVAIYLGDCSSILRVWQPSGKKIASGRLKFLDSDFSSSGVSTKQRLVKETSSLTLETLARNSEFIFVSSVYIVGVSGASRTVAVITSSSLYILAIRRKKKYYNYKLH